MWVKIESQFYSTLRMLAGYAIYVNFKVHGFNCKNISNRIRKFSNL